jgi:hypothetical protein
MLSEPVFFHLVTNADSTVQELERKGKNNKEFGKSSLVNSDLIFHTVALVYLLLTISL